MARTEERKEAGPVEERVVSSEATAQLSTSEAPKLRPIRRIRELWRYREILGNLTRKEVKVKYTSSVLGAAWAMLNPLLFLVVFWVVFGVILKSGVPEFPIYILSGILAWNVFNSSLTGASRSVVENANLVKKVYFPREILPLSSIGVSLVDFVFQAVVLAIFLALLTHSPFGWNMILLPLSLLALLLLSTALSFLVAALNVKYRDTQHLLSLALMTLFWLSGVIYPLGLVQQRFEESRFGEAGLYAYLILNPISTILAGFQRAIYKNVTYVADGKVQPALLNFSVPKMSLFLGIACVESILLGLLTWRYFFRQAGDFAEEL
jgi:ABC-2 type transport system permease protein